jgi:hypothetical protein
VKVHVIPDLPPNQSWKTSSINGLPSGIGLSRLSSTGFGIAYYHSAICIAFAGDPAKDVDGKVGGGETASAILYTPHGVTKTSVEKIETCGVSSVLAVLHGLHDVRNPRVSIGAERFQRSHIADMMRSAIDTGRAAESGRSQWRSNRSFDSDEILDWDAR